MKENKNIYTITFHHVLNYGAVLQAYALTKLLKDNDFHARIIDYRPSYFMFQTYRPRKGVLKTINKIKKMIRFYRFRKQHLPLTSKIFFNVKHLKKYFENSNNIFICGSDQIWNTDLTDNKLDDGFFLNFLPKSASKIAYAASIGNTSFKIENYDAVFQNLKSFDKILVREDFAFSEVSKISSNTLQAEIVVDPTLLIDDYSDILDFSLVPDYPYIVSYLTEDSDAVRKYIKKTVKFTKLPLINLGHHYIADAQKNYLYESPSKWLGVFSKATFVCTNSFHGNAYSLIFKRNFTVFSRTTKVELNRRQLTLLENLNLENRFVYKEGDLKNEHFEEIDYNIVSPIYNKLIDKSKQLLLQSISDSL